MEPDADLNRTVEAVWRIESPRVIAVLARMLRDVGLAEELAQDALVAALEHWPQSGLPDRPGAWLMATAKRRAIDALRHRRLQQDRHASIAQELEGSAMPGPEADEHLEDGIGDDLLRLMFVACHPVLPRESRVALTLRLLGGLSTAEIARAFLVAEPTVAQRLVRARRTLAEREVPFEVPRGAELAERLASVLEVIYLVFNEGYAATAGPEWMRPSLCEEALRLGRVLAGLAPREPEVHALVALMELQASRLGARAQADGTPVLLMDQDRSKWDHLLVGRGLASLARTEALGGEDGPFALQAAIAACHARARTAGATDWPRIAVLYGRLVAALPSPVVELNRAVAVGMAEGAAAGLAIADALRSEPALARYPLLPAVRGDLLFRLGELDQAREQFERAAELTQNAREKAVMLGRAAACGRAPSAAR